MKIRRARNQDCAALARLRRSTIHAVNARDYSKKVIRLWSEQITAQDLRQTAARCKRWVALDNGKIIGFCEHDFKGGLSRIYVHKNYLRKGIGSQLLNRAEASLKKQGCKRIRVESTVTAKIFYEKNGYHVLRKTRHEGDGSPVYKMLKRLS